MTQKLRIGLIFGGRSGEHEVSLQSAKSIYQALNKDTYEVLPIGIDKQGHWHLGSGSDFILNAENPKLIKLNQAAPQITALQTNQSVELRSIDSNQNLGSIDVFFPIIHGTYGEDGSLQGLLELLNIAYVGAGVLGSAVGMDKSVMKRLLREAGLPIGDFITVTSSQRDIIDYNTITDQLAFPLFVKPANMGSSVGVTKVHSLEGLENAIQTAFNFDTKILLEEFIPGREVECSVLGNDNPKASIPGEVIPNHEFYSYDAKYIDEHGAGLEIPAKLSSELTTQVQDLAIKAFKALECQGMARVDMFVRKDDNRILINEINTLPGFTKISMYPKLWEASGIPYPQLLDELINLALERHQQKQQLKRDYV